MPRANELVMERPSATISATRTGTLKSILFAVHEDEGLESRLQAALSLARACSAHLELVHVIPIEAFTIVDSYGGTYVSGQIVEALEEEGAKLRARLEDHLSKEDVSWNYELTMEATFPAFVRDSALADLFFIGRQPRHREFTRTGPSLIGELVYSARTPLCIPGDGASGFDPFGNAVIAWNGSVEAANAVRASVGLLRMASDVRVLRFAEAKEHPFPDTRLMDYLSRHGITAVLDEHRAAKGDVTDRLVEYACAFAAQYVVMGGYSHTRAGEFLFGGVTRELLHACPVSLVMAH